MYYLAVDIGASSGRHILGKLENGKLELTEIYRFENGYEKQGEKLVWNIEKLFKNIVEGIKKCNDYGAIPYSIGIDTWGVDYALLDKNGNIIDEVYSYRDSRNNEGVKGVEEIIPFSELYQETGIQKASYNTIYQLYCDKISGKLSKAKRILSVPDTLHYLLTGVMKNEYTHASTTGMLNAKTGTWSEMIIEKLGYPREIFGTIYPAGEISGHLKKEIQQEVGFDCLVVLPASHDTASAVMAVPSDSEFPLYISSGTWSLLGTELKAPVTDQKAYEFNATNEGGFGGTIRFLRNITGMWAIQSIKRELENKYGYQELMYLAMDEKDFDSIVDLNDERFLAPDSMINTIKDYCRETNQKVPENVGQVMNVVYRSLAGIYKDTIVKMEEVTGKTFDTINIVGGGSKDEYLNTLTKNYTGKRVIAGPTEGTAVGNLLSQAISSGEVKDLKEGRKIVTNSFKVKEI